MTKSNMIDNEIAAKEIPLTVLVSMLPGLNWILQKLVYRQQECKEYFIGIAVQKVITETYFSFFFLTYIASFHPVLSTCWLSFETIIDNAGTNCYFAICLHCFFNRRGWQFRYFLSRSTLYLHFTLTLFCVILDG